MVDRLLSSDGKCVFSFWHKSLDRVEIACQRSQLNVEGRVDVLMGRPGFNIPHLSIFVVHRSQDSSFITNYPTTSIDITRNSETGGLSEVYRGIQSRLGMRARPLKYVN